MNIKNVHLCIPAVAYCSLPPAPAQVNHSGTLWWDRINASEPNLMLNPDIALAWNIGSPDLVTGDGIAPSCAARTPACPAQQLGVASAGPAIETSSELAAFYAFDKGLWLRHFAAAYDKLVRQGGGAALTQIAYSDAPCCCDAPCPRVAAVTDEAAATAGCSARYALDLPDTAPQTTAEGGGAAAAAQAAAPLLATAVGGAAVMGVVVVAFRMLAARKRSSTVDPSVAAAEAASKAAAAAEEGKANNALPPSPRLWAELGYAEAQRAARPFSASLRALYPPPG